MKYRLTEMDFYEDGLKSETTVFESIDPTECWKRYVQCEQNNPYFMGRVIVIGDDDKPVYEDHPYPRIKELEYPDFVMDTLKRR